MTPVSRRSFIALSAMLPWAFSARAATSIPVGLEMYSVRNALKQDPEGTVRAVAHAGYAGLEFYAPYFDWTEAETKQMRKLLDDLGIRCFSTHNSASYFSAENLPRARDMNLILGSRYVVMASSQPKPGLDGWKEVADTLNRAARATGARRPQGRVSQSSTGVHPGRRVGDPSRFWRRTPSRRSCCNWMWAHALKRAGIPRLGFARILGEFARCT